MKVIDEDLEVVDQFKLPNFDRVISFSVINESCLHLIGTLPEDFEFVEAQSDSDDDDFGVERNDDDLRVSWLLNLDDLSLKRLEVEGEGPLYGVPRYLGSGQLLCFTRDSQALQGGASDGIYVLDMNN